MTDKFICPACGEKLFKSENSLICLNNHSFDIAKQGYVHLIMSNKMHSKNPGDTKEMVDARRRFFELGKYNIFQNKLIELVKKYEENPKVILDAGCGEAYYTGKIKENTDSEVIGFDISKFAVKSAASKYKNISFAVASCFNIPLGDNSCDMLIDVFSPIAQEEFFRVLKKEGIFIYAIPGKRHLYELKEVLYENPYENPVKDTEYTGFTLLDRVSVKDRIFLENNNEIWDLFSMTPYYWKTDVKGGEKLRQTQKLETEIHFDFLIYKKNKE